MRLTPYFAPTAVVVVSLYGAAFGQTADRQDDAYDPDSASRGVARISVINGDVSIRRGDSGDYVAAAINAPLVVGDRVLTGPNARAEVQFDWANMIRIAGDTEIRLSELAYRRYQIQLARGVATFRVLRNSDADVEVSTPQVSIRPKKQGVYRLAVPDENQSEVTVRSGEVEIFTPRGVETLRSGKTMQVRGTASDPEFQVVSAMREDDWDRWNRNRDKDLERSASYRYVSPDVYGVDDLDSYGRWVPDPTYGHVWSPRVAIGWAPYRAGRWSWIDYYGWSWISYDPWGWAPYHYGRWYVSPSYGWCWYPGGRGYGARHYWSPGLVAFVGFGHGNVGIGFGNIGWVPLAPHERYNRWYGRGYYGGRSDVTIVNNVNIYNTYRNARIRNAVTSVDGTGFGRGAGGRAWTGDLRQASLVNGQLPVTPGRESLRLSDREVRQASLPRTADNQRFFSQRQAAQVERIPFEQQRQRIEQANGNNASLRSFDSPRVSGPGVQQVERQNGWRRSSEAQPNGLAEASPSRVDRGESRTVAPATSNRGWARFGEPAGRIGETQPSRVDRGASRSRESRTESGSSSRGWGGFGQPSGRTAERQESRPANEAGIAAPAPESAPRQRDYGSRQERGNTSRFDRPSYIDRSGGSRGAGSSPESVRISPPMVRERSASPRSESARPSGGGGESGAVSRGGGGGRGESRGGRSR